MADVQHDGAVRLLRIIREHQRRNLPLTYADVAVQLGRKRNHGRAIASMCDLLDAAAALSGRPLLALTAVKSSNHEFNPKAWTGDGIPPDLREKVFQKSLAHKFSAEDYRAILNALKQLAGHGNRSAWEHVRSSLGREKLFATIADSGAGGSIEARSEPYGLILAENEATAGEFDWHDVTGERYHFPKNYRNTIRPGTPFIYYSGTRGLKGKRKEAHYFGHGVVGDVYPDPDTTHMKRGQWKWIAEIEYYEPFNSNVALRDASGKYVEVGSASIPARNFWGIGVRPVSKDRFDAIVSAGLGPGAKPEPIVTLGTLTAAIEPLMRVRAPATNDSGATRRAFDGRRSGQAKITGDAAEKLFYEHLRRAEPDPKERTKIVWVAKVGETPGFDIEDRRKGAGIAAYEVKGTVGSTFPSFELTENEMRAAEKLKERYAVVLVTECLGKSPRFEVLKDLSKHLEQSTLAAIPSAYRIERRK